MFRNHLEQGLTVDRLAADFEATGVPLPRRSSLCAWEQRAGRYRLHDQVAVIEFGADMTPEEIQAILRIGGDWLYQVARAAWCALDASIQELLGDLRRRSAPQVKP